jgi:hypothetical protein
MNTYSIHDFIPEQILVGYFKIMDLAVKKYINCMILTISQESATQIKQL